VNVDRALAEKGAKSQMPIRQLFSTDVVSMSTMPACPIERSTAEIH
jgi:hypothetical protein